MQFQLTILDPATMKVGKETYIHLKAGVELHRIHLTSFGSTQFNDTAKGTARFSPIRDVHGTIIPTIYGGESFECATCEIILRSPSALPTNPATGLPTLQIVPPSDHANRSHSVVRTTADLKLVDLSIAGQRRIGVNKNALLAGPEITYSATRGWAERIHAVCPTAQGLHYISSQYGPHFAVVLFGDRLGPGTLTQVSTRLVKDPPCDNEIRVLAQSLSIEYENL